MAASRAKDDGAKRSAKDPEAEVLEVIAAMPGWEREVAERLHAVIRDNAPDLTPRLWYKQPAYARGGKTGKVVCFFRGAEVDGERYLTLGFTGDSALDDGHMWPTAFALTGLGEADEEAVAELVRRAAG